MGRKKTPAPRRAGTAKKARNITSAMRSLDYLRQHDPARYEAAIDLVVALAVSARSKIK